MTSDTKTSTANKGVRIIWEGTLRYNDANDSSVVIKERKHRTRVIRVDKNFTTTFVVEVMSGTDIFGKENWENLEEDTKLYVNSVLLALSQATNEKPSPNQDDF